MKFFALRLVPNAPLLALGLLAVQSGCNSSTEAPPATIAQVCQIHLQSGFSHTPVRVSIDFSQVFSDTVTSGIIAPVAAIIPVQVYNGTHLLNVTVPNSVSKDTMFTIADSLYIGVNYDATTPRITYHFQRLPFYYR
jgi:hypothetical protein